MRKLAFLFLLLPVFCTLTTVSGCSEPETTVVEPTDEMTPEEMAEEESEGETSDE